MDKAETIKFFDESAGVCDAWREKNWYYHRDILRLSSFMVPPGSSVLEIGCATGDLLNDLHPRDGMGVDISRKMIDVATSRYPGLTFSVDDIENLSLNRKFDYVVMQNITGHLHDIWLAFRNLRRVTTTETRVILTFYNHLWEPLVVLAEKLGFKQKSPQQNWLAQQDIENLLYLNGYEIVRSGRRFLMPFYIPLLSDLINRYIARLPLLKQLCMVQFVVARETAAGLPREKTCSVSVIIPSRNEAGNISRLVAEIPALGSHTEIIFVDGQSSDGTVEKIKEAIAEYPEKDIKLIPQGGAFGKADAVRKGFEAAAGELLMILDADITVEPKDLEKFYLAETEGKGEFINGSRLVYPMEKAAMRTLNMLGNKVFSMIFTWTLGQNIKDTLCGTKVLFKKDYLKIQAGRHYFGDFDPFGDFDLLFGASKLNLRIVELPVSYKERKYGETKISRFRHGLLLLKMSFVAFKKFKLN
jgi:SAM-dependent methyltransferase